MLIELATHNYQITWPKYDRATHQEIVRRLKTISGAEFDRTMKCWWVPLAQGAKLLELFWRASYSPDAMCAAIDAESDRVRHFYESLCLMGIILQIGAQGELVAVGESVSPLIQSLVAERAEALRPLVAGAQPKPQPAAASPVASTPLTEDEQLGPLFRGIQNAKAKAEADAVRYPRWRKKVKQGQ